MCTDKVFVWNFQNEYWMLAVPGRQIIIQSNVWLCSIVPIFPTEHATLCSSCRKVNWTKSENLLSKTNNTHIELLLNNDIHYRNAHNDPANNAQSLAANNRQIESQNNYERKFSRHLNHWKMRKTSAENDSFMRFNWILWLWLNQSPNNSRKK